MNNIWSQQMKWVHKSIVISILAATLIPVVACSVPASTTMPSSATPYSSLTPSTSPAFSPTLSVVPTVSPVKPTPTSSASPTIVSSPTPILSPAPNPATDKNFYIDRTISGYTETPRADGSIERTSVFKDIFLDLNILGYYTNKDAVFVPRIPTITNHDDWFIRIKIPGFLLKPWLMNWDYTVNKSNPTATLSATVYTQELFNANYYNHPDLLLGYDLKGDRVSSSSGINCKYFQTPGDYVILLRTNDASAISDFWIKLGTEGSITTPTP
jgi:hypothetical protein